MLTEHVITEEALEHIKTGLVAGRHWLAYNTISYFLEKADVYLFSDKEEAKEFSANNISEYDDYSVVPLNSIEDIRHHITDEERFQTIPPDPDANFEQNQIIHSNKTKVMNENNFDYLSKQIFYKGFGNEHAETLKEKMKEGQSEFLLTHQQDFGKDSTAATLHFKKSGESDMYFFNSYQLAMKPAGQEQYIQQTFYVNSDPKKREHEDMTLKEGYNLLSGRAVNKNQVSKEGEKYNAWVQLDFKTTDSRGNYEEKKFHQNYGFDLEKSLGKHPIKELADPTQHERLVDSLKRGNRQSVTLQHGGTDQKISIEAAPQYKGLNFYDSNMKRLNIQTLYEGKAEGQSENKAEGKQESKSAAMKKDEGPDDEGGAGKPSQNTNKRKNRGQSIA